MDKKFPRSFQKQKHKKSAATEVNRTKNANSDSRQTNRKEQEQICATLGRNLHFYQTQTSMVQKGYNYPIEIKIALAQNYSVGLANIV